MPTDTPSSPAGQPRRTRRESLFYDQAGMRDLTVDDHQFVVPANQGWQQASFRVQLFTGAGLRPIAVITQIVPTEGAGPVNHAERYAEAIWRHLLPTDPLPPIIIGHMLTADEGDGVQDLGWMPVDFRVADASQHTLQRPAIWGGRIDDAALQYLVGHPVDPGRGTIKGTRPRWWHRK
ncbi:hypothetical protein [Actinoplanes sp. HUAS TT8]|uniref:hypothetical protein n=1 Tax=Actinoplanes sp. HUAS TT8 TaxID=3447453 RepID=UPI003F524445